LDTGGNNVRTAVYNVNYKVSQIEKLELKRWHLINTGMLHVINPDKVRIAISIGSENFR
jgi:hypothetical protein